MDRSSNGSSNQGFLDSMTFTNTKRLLTSSSNNLNGNNNDYDTSNGCDCDECCNGTDRMLTMTTTKSAIELAVENHRSKKYKIEVPVISARYQERKFIARKDCYDTSNNNGFVISLYKYTIPIDATPLFEFGDSIRIVFVFYKHDVSIN